MAERAGYLPGLDADALQWEAHNYGPREASLLVLLPVLKGEQITAVTQHVRSQAVRSVENASGRTDCRRDRSCGCATAWTGTIPIGARWIDLLPVITGYDAGRWCGLA